LIAERCFSRAKFEEAQVSEVLFASPKRMTPKCAVFGICGGCSFQYLSSTDQIDAKGKWLKDAFQRLRVFLLHCPTPPNVAQLKDAILRIYPYWQSSLIFFLENPPILCLF
jgi:tRNA/tmRNA/rRNA uracil-C5-methylase (TrmA/RlmC/RlmD family)